MPHLQEAEVQPALTRLQDLRALAAIRSPETRHALAALLPCLDAIDQKIGAGAPATFDAAKWAGLTDAEKEALSDQVDGAERSLRAALDDGPTDVDHIMHKDYASNRWIIVLTVIGMLATALVIWRIHQYWPSATYIDVKNPPQERDILRMVVMMGTLGGLVHFTSSLAMFIGNRRLQRSWIVYYLLMPFEGAALAPMVYLLLRVGVLGADSSTGNLNHLGLYAFAALTGLFSKQAIEMLADVFNTVFKKVRAKDGLDKGKQTGSEAP